MRKEDKWITEYKKKKQGISENRGSVHIEKRRAET